MVILISNMHLDNLLKRETDRQAPNALHHNPNFAIFRKLNRQNSHQLYEHFNSLSIPLSVTLLGLLADSFENPSNALNSAIIDSYLKTLPSNFPILQIYLSITLIPLVIVRILPPKLTIIVGIFPFFLCACTSHSKSI